MSGVRLWLLWILAIVRSTEPSRWASISRAMELQGVFFNLVEQACGIRLDRTSFCCLDQWELLS
jgi:hypothetical protein